MEAEALGHPCLMKILKELREWRAGDKQACDITEDNVLGWRLDQVCITPPWANRYQWKRHDL